MYVCDIVCLCMLNTNLRTFERKINKQSFVFTYELIAVKLKSILNFFWIYFKQLKVYYRKCKVYNFLGNEFICMVL